MSTTSHRVIVAANRLPMRWDTDRELWAASPGGLVSALVPVLQERNGVWVGWDGTADGPAEPSQFEGISVRPVGLTAAEVENHYHGFSNGSIWPLYHDVIRPPEFHRHWWRPHVEVNRRFADLITDAASPDDTVWVHDYQLQLVPGMVRERLPQARIGFFLHIPFPPPELFERLPWRRQILDGLLGAGFLGFQTRRASLNFAASAREFAGARGPADRLVYEGRNVSTETLPISIEFERYADVAGQEGTQKAAFAFRQDLGEPETIILGVDRLDYTKGIDLRLRAFESLIEENPDTIGRVSLVQLAVPSRESVDEYQQIRRRVEEMVGRINGRFGQAAWQPVHYLYRSLDLDDLVAAYVAADVMLVTPLRDGMNLVAKEYVASRIQNTGVLMLSEFAGAAERLTDALLVNPYDVDSMTETLGKAVTMSPEEQFGRMRRMRRAVHRWDVHRWARHNLNRIESAG